MVTVADYHDRTKHHFHRYARSLGHLDWASQPDPFRRYPGADLVPLSREPLATGLSFSGLFETQPPAPLTSATLAEFLRCSLGLSAWKQAGATRWALRVNPSSGNLHPTEGYVVTPPGLCGPASVFHYAPREHALERRATLAAADFPAPGRSGDAFLVGLSSIHWREAWKYGERAYRYCQHDVGHAIGALRYAAALLGWRLQVLPRWSDADLATLLGLDRLVGEGVEVETPDCLAVVTAGDVAPWQLLQPDVLVGAARRADWSGIANRLSEGHQPWPVIEDVAEAAAFPGVAQPDTTVSSSAVVGARGAGPVMQPEADARETLLQRRSAVAFDGTGCLDGQAFGRMLNQLRPSSPPSDALWWPACVHLVLFVHRVTGLTPGIYAFLRQADAQATLQVAMRPDFLWEAVPGYDGLYLLAPLDCRAIAQRLSCDQAIAADGFLSAAMLAPFEATLQTSGPWAYRHLFWECGLVGQVLYLEAEAAGGRSTGIGCFFDDAVHSLLGLEGHAWQSLYHFSMGVPVDDGRLLTLPGYDWERPA